MSVVYITSRKMSGCNDKVYHLTDECKQLTNANTVYEKPKNVLTGYRLCKLCSGDAEDYDKADFSTHAKLSDPNFTAEDLGL